MFRVSGHVGDGDAGIKCPGEGGRMFCQGWKLAGAETAAGFGLRVARQSGTLTVAPRNWSTWIAVVVCCAIGVGFIFHDLFPPGIAFAAQIRLLFPHVYWWTPISANCTDL
jgi:hypothetical protein